MEEATEYTFRTKTGTCTTTPDQIILARGGVRGAAAQGIYGSSIGRAMVMYGLLGLTALAVGVWTLVHDDAMQGALLCLIGVYFLWTVVASRNNSATPVLQRSAIRRVEAQPPRPPITRGYFTVLFEEDGRLRKRIIMLPGSLDRGQEEYARAEAAMRAAGLLGET